MVLPEKVINKRRRLYSQAEMAKMLKVSRSTICCLEADPMSVHLSTLNAYAQALGWRLRWVPAFHERSPHKPVEQPPV